MTKNCRNEKNRRLDIQKKVAASQKNSGIQSIDLSTGVPTIKLGIKLGNFLMDCAQKLFKR